MKSFDFIKDLFGVEEIQTLKIENVAMALSDHAVRAHWLRELLREIQTINCSIDSDLLQKKEAEIKEKSARRRTLQYVLEQALVSRRVVEGQHGHNPTTGASVWFDKRSTTA